MKWIPALKQNVLFLAVILVVTPACSQATLTVSTPVQATATPTVGRIAFYSDRADKYGGREHDIYLVNVDGSGMTRLTDDGASWGLAWSPDGQRLAFASWCNGDTEIRIVKSDGSGSRCVTQIGNLGPPIAWSPDGQTMAFVSSPHQGIIYVLNIEEALQGKPSSTPKPLNWRGLDFIQNIAWSPDGQQITFSYSENVDAPDEIALLNVEQALQSTGGIGWTILSKGSAPTWSPDGQLIAFVSSSQDDNPGISVMDANGNHQIRLTNDSLYPAWSPDSQKIAFMSNRDGNWEIYVMEANGGPPTRLTNSSAIDSYPAWSPDGRQIAFVSGEDSASGNIYVMNSDGSHLMRLTDIPFWPQVPMWAPR